MNMLAPTGIIKRMLLFVVSTAGEFVWNEGGAVQLPAPYIMVFDFLTLSYNKSNVWICLHIDKTYINNIKGKKAHP